MGMAKWKSMKKMKKRMWIPKRGYCCDDEDE